MSTARVDFSINKAFLAPTEEEKRNLSRDIEISHREFAEGNGIPSDEVFREMDEMIKGGCSSPTATRSRIRQRILF